LANSSALTAHQKEFTSKEQSYWSQGKAVQGEWQGRLAAEYGLVGEGQALVPEHVAENAGIDEGIE